MVKSLENNQDPTKRVRTRKEKALRAEAFSKRGDRNEPRAIVTKK